MLTKLISDLEGRVDRVRMASDDFPDPEDPTAQCTNGCTGTCLTCGSNHYSCETCTCTCLTCWD